MAHTAGCPTSPACRKIEGANVLDGAGRVRAALVQDIVGDRGWSSDGRCLEKLIQGLGRDGQKRLDLLAERGVVATRGVEAG